MLSTETSIPVAGKNHAALVGDGNLPVNQAQYPFVTWENWIEQAQMFPEGLQKI